MKNQLETLSFLEQEEKREQSVNNLINKTIQAMEKCSSAMENSNKVINEIIGEDKEHVNN